MWLLAIAAINSYVWYHVGKAKSDKEWEAAMTVVIKRLEDKHGL